MPDVKKHCLENYKCKRTDIDDDESLFICSRCGGIMLKEMEVERGICDDCYNALK